MKTKILTFVTMALFFVTFIGCKKEDIQVKNPMDELQDAMQTHTPLSLAIPSDKKFTLENPCTDEDLLRFEQERILKEKNSSSSLKAMPNGNYSFSYDVTFTKSCGGTTLYNNGYAKGEITAGGITYKPRLYFAANISGGQLQNTICYIENTVTFNPTFKVTLYKSISSTYSKQLYTSQNIAFSLVGGWLPTWVVYGATLDGSVYMNATGSAWMQQKIQIVSSATIGAKWIKGTGWSGVSVAPSPSVTYWSPSYGYSVSFSVQPKMVAQVYAMIDGVVGPRLTLTPYFNFYLSASSRYIDQYAGIKGDVYFSLSKLAGGSDLYSKTVFNVQRTIPRINF